MTLDASGGNLTLRWKAANPAGTSGTSYIIRRRLPGETEFAFIGVSGKKEFVDDSLIAGPDSVQYTVQGQRADSSGPLSPIFTVNFGRAGRRVHGDGHGGRVRGDAFDGGRAGGAEGAAEWEREREARQGAGLASGRPTAAGDRRPPQEGRLPSE